MGDFKYKIIPKRLLENKLPSYKQCINKEEFFMKRLEKKNKKIFDKIKSVLKFCTSKESSIFDTIYGEIKTKSYLLERVEDLSINMAEDKTDFWVKRNKFIREDYNNIDYSNVNYIDNSNKVDLRCKIHNYRYYQRPSHHTSSVQGCPYCMKSVIKYSKENFKNHKDFFKGHISYLYVLKIESEKESFYKVGMTSKNSFKARLNRIKSNYEIEILYRQEGYPEDIYDLEQRFLEKFKNYKYTPEKDFSGKTECLTVNPVHLYNGWYKNYINYE